MKWVLYCDKIMQEGYLNDEGRITNALDFALFFESKKDAENYLHRIDGGNYLKVSKIGKGDLI